MVNHMQETVAVSTLSESLSSFQRFDPFERLSLVGIDILCDPIFTQGYRCGYEHAHQAGEGILLTDQHMTILINEQCPSTLAPCHLPDWRRGFLLGWMACWFEHHLQTSKASPFLPALLEHPDFREGMCDGVQTFQEAMFEEDHEKAGTEDEIMQFVGEELSEQKYRREQRIDQLMGHPSPSYLHHLGFMISYLDQALATKAK